MAEPSPNSRRYSVTPSLVALGLGLVVGIAAYQTGWAPLHGVLGLVDPVGQLWLRALQMTVFPLVILNLIVAILNSSDTGSFGRLSLGVLALFVLFLAAGGGLAMTAGAVVIRMLPIDPNAGQALASMSEQAAELASRTEVQPSFGAWLMELIPTNPFASLSEGQLLPVLVFTVLFAIALTKVTVENRQVAHRFFQAACEAMLVLVGWVLWVTPLGVFALTAVIASGLGASAVTALVQYVLVTVTFLIGATLLLYPITALLGGESIRRFGRTVLPAQIVAFSTRSSLASLPALLDAAKGRNDIVPGIANLALPLSVSVFKVNRTITSTLRLLLIAHVFGIDITLAQTVTFIVTIIVLSFSSLGIPLGGGGMKSLPAYIAAGVPLEAYILFRAVESIPDIFKTVLNVTCDMSVTVIANRWFRSEFEEQTEKGPAADTVVTAHAVSVRDER